MPTMQPWWDKSKFSVLTLISDHYRTLYRYSPDATGKLSLFEFFTFLGIPAFAALLVWWTKTSIQHVPEILGAVAILTGLTFNVFVLLFDLTMRAWDKSTGVITGPSAALLADELRANISYAVLLGLTLSAVLGGLAMFTDTARVGLPWSCLSVFLGAQLIMTLGMCLKRVRAMFRVLGKGDGEQIP